MCKIPDEQNDGQHPSEGHAANERHEPRCDHEQHDFADFRAAVRLVGDYHPDRLRKLADQLAELQRLLADDDVFDVFAGAIADARDEAPRHPDDRDSGDVLEQVIAQLRRAGSSTPSSGQPA